MRNRFNKGGLRTLGIIVAVVATIALFLHFSMALQATDGPLRWESSGQVTVLDENNQVTLTFTLVGGDNVVGEVTGAAFTLVAPVGGWTVVSSTGFDMPPSGPPLHVGPPLGYVAMGNVLEPPIEVPYVVTLTLQFANGAVLEDGVLFDVVGRFDHGGSTLTQSPGSPGGGITIFPEPTEEASFDLISTSFAWSEKLTSIVIDLGEGNSIETSALDEDTFTVIATHLRVTGMTPAWMAMNEMERVVRNIYASNVNEEGYPAERGRYIVVEFMVWGPYRGLATGDGGATPQFHFRYNVTANQVVPLYDSDLTLLDFNFNQSGTNEAGFGFSRNVLIDQFIPTIGRTIEGLPGSLTYSTFLSRDENGEPLNNRPLFIHLHGGGQGNHWRQPLGYSNHGTIFAEPRWQERFQTHILVPANFGTDSSFGILPAVVKEMIADGLVDANRVYISGYSAGSTATINYLIRHADLFAAAIPIANDPLQPGGVINQAVIDIIKDIPMWWFNSEGEYSNNGLIRCWVNLELFFGRAGGTLTARQCRVNPVTRPGLNEPITEDGLGLQLTNSRYTRFWDNNIAKFPYGPDIWLAYLPHNEITDDGFWIFNGHQSWIPAFNDGLNVMEVYTIGWEPHARYDGFTPGDSTPVFDWLFAQCLSQRMPYEWRLADPNNIRVGQEYIVVSEYGALTNVGTVFPKPDEGRADPLGMTITPVTTEGEWITSEVTPEMIWQFGLGNNVAAAAGGLGEGPGFHLLNDAPGTNAGRFPLRRDGSLSFPTAPIMTTSMAVPNNQSLLLHVLDEAERTVSLYFWTGNNAWNFALEGTPLGFTARGASSNAAQLMPFMENAPLRLYERVTALPQHSILATAGANGSISPTTLSGHVWVDEGADKTFALTPAFGFVIDTVLVNGEPVTVTDNTFTFENVTKHQTIHVTFKADATSVEIPFTVYNDIFPASGIVPFVYTTALIIDLGEGNSANLADIDKEMFIVSARNTRLNGVTLVFEGERAITRAYVNTEPVPLGYIAPYPGSSDLVTATPASGRYIILELKFWGPGGPILAARADDGANSTLLNYRINVDRNLVYQVGGTSQTVIPRFEQENVVTPAIDRFVPDRTNPGGPGDMRILVAIHEAYQETGPLPLFVYNHGGGRAGPAGEADRFAPLMTLSGAAVLSKLQMEHPGRFDAHIIATQGHAGNQANRDAFIAYVEDMVERGLVDPNRIYMSGFSAGGGYTMGFVNNNPEFLAAAVPVGSGAIEFPTQAQLDDNPEILNVALWFIMHRLESIHNSGYILYNLFQEGGLAASGQFRDISLSFLNTHEIVRFPFFGWSEGNTHETEGAAFGQYLGEMDVYFRFGEHHEAFANLYIFDWLFAQCRSQIERPEYTLTFHLYTDDQMIWDAFADYITDEVDGRPVVVVPVVSGTANTTWDGLDDALSIGNIYGTVGQPGYAFWGWFTDEMLDASGRIGGGLRRPALTIPDYFECYVLENLILSIEKGTAVFIDNNIDVYLVWVRWGDVDDNGLVNMADLNLLQRHVNFSHLLPVAFNGAAADVVVDGAINMFDLNLLQRFTNFGHLITVVLGEAPQP